MFSALSGARRTLCGGCWSHVFHPGSPVGPCALPRAQKPSRDAAHTGSDVQLQEGYGRRAACVWDGSLSLSFRGNLCVSCISAASSGSPMAPSSVTLGSAPQCNPSQAFVPRTTSPPHAGDSSAGLCFSNLGVHSNHLGGLSAQTPGPSCPGSQTQRDCNCHLFPGDAASSWVKAPASAGDPDPHCVVWPACFTS